MSQKLSDAEKSCNPNAIAYRRPSLKPFENKKAIIKPDIGSITRLKYIPT